MTSPLDLLRVMVRIRAFEEAVGELFVRGGTAGTMLHLSIGEEGAAAGFGLAMRPGDTFTTHHRGHGVFLARGGDPRRMMAEIAGKAAGSCRGRGGSMHIADVTLGHLGANAIVGGGIPHVVGAALAARHLGSGNVSVAFFGDGAMQQGVLYESMNLAALWRLPVVFACVNNQYGMGTRIDRAAASLDFDARARAFGLRGVTVDASDATAVFETATQVLADAREGRPALVTLDCFRFYGHARKDRSPYRTEEEEREGRSRDPVARLADRLRGEDVLDDDTLTAMRDDARREMDDAVAFALAAPPPDLAALHEDVYAPDRPAPPSVDAYHALVYPEGEARA
ncbi:thiamine pyrophosphate-dependent dehydrogenase E1 component subunit alpha [Deinococcus pimensis]|uniref:thiamine pyrophosphate-dependent dehydrogenase E1 component subunit alpha n=1 Tax=Deinococcus pimensis TaxID=309888 RepID=UPI0004B1F3C0|nr:thiamine pyrophosphate-dependent dehydrogenase E1 component subunit alpha [Deinococcus pimensis]